MALLAHISEILLKFTDDDDRDVRRNMAIVASYMRSRAAKVVLEHLLGDGNAPTFGDERAIGARLQPATDKMLIAPEARHKPSQAITTSVLRSPDEISILIKQLRDPDTSKQAGGELIEREEGVVRPLIAALGEAHPVGERALEILRAMGRTAHPELLNLTSMSVVVPAALGIDNGTMPVVSASTLSRTSASLRSRVPECRSAALLVPPAPAR